MKIVKYFIFLILILFIAGSIYVATKKGDYKVEATKIIEAPAPLLFEEVADLSSWEEWESWGGMEGTVLDFSEPTTGEEAVMNWQGEEIRDGRIVTVAASPYSELEQKLVVQTVIGEAEARMEWSFEPVEEGTKVTWTLEGSQSFKEKLAFSLQDNEIPEVFKPVFEAALADLEESVLQKMAEYKINVDGVTEHGGGYYMYMTTAARLSEVNEKAADMAEQVRLYMEENNISITGRPMVIYNQRDEMNSTSIFSAAIPTPSQVITPEGSPVLTGFLEPQKVVKATLKGDHSNAPEAWENVYRYIEENGLVVNPQGQPFEMYITNPEEKENPAEWVTEIYVPVE